MFRYFFIPSFKAHSNRADGLDEVTVYVISLGYTVIITTLYLCFVSLLSNSWFVKRYVLEQK